MTSEILDPSADESESATLAGVPESDGAGFPEVEQPSKKRKAWSFPDLDEPKLERAPLTEEEWQKVLRAASRGRTVVFLVTREQREWAGNQARSCGACTQVKLHGDPRRGWCTAQRMMTGITFPVLCRTYAS